MKSNITKTFVESIKPTSKDLIVWDNKLCGFGVRIKPSGTKTYLCQYRNEYGNSRRKSLGSCNILSTEEARKAAKKLLANVEIGNDPAQEALEKRKEMPIKELAELYLKEGVAHKKQSTISTDIGRINRHIIPLIGNKKVTQLKRADVNLMMQHIADGKTAVNKASGKLRGRTVVSGGKGTATKAVRILGAMYSFAIDRGFVETSPTSGVKVFKDNQVDRFLNESELSRLGAVNKSLKDTELEMASNIITLLLLTGCRKSEISNLEWEWIDYERRCIRLPDAKTGSRLVGLGETALNFIQGLPKNNYRYVFPNKDGSAAYTGTNKAWPRTIRKNADLEDVRIHDLRHTFASIGAELGYSELTIGALLGHSNGSTTGRYVHFGQDPIGKAASHISEVIWERLEREPI